MGAIHRRRGALWRLAAILSAPLVATVVRAPMAGAALPPEQFVQTFAALILDVISDRSQPPAERMHQLLQAALERWEKVEQEEVFGQMESIADPAERLRVLFRLVAHEYKSHIIYSELLKALDHPTVQPVIGRVSGRRMEFLTACFRQAGLNRTEAQHRARLTYAAYIGFLQLNLQLHQARLQHDEFEAYVEHVMATLIPPAMSPLP